MENIETKLREEAKRLLLEKKADVIIGYEKGTLPLTATPCFITTPEEADKLVWNDLCSQNLAKFVHDLISQHKNSQKRVKPEDRKKKMNANDRMMSASEEARANVKTLRN